jgi:hypothetical protein
MARRVSRSVRRARAILDDSVCHQAFWSPSLATTLKLLITKGFRYHPRTIRARRGAPAYYRKTGRRGPRSAPRRDATSNAPAYTRQSSLGEQVGSVPIRHTWPRWALRAAAISSIIMACMHVHVTRLQIP